MTTQGGPPIELSAVEAFGVDYLPEAPSSYSEQLEKVRAFFLPYRHERRLLGDLLPKRMAWFKKYAAPYLTSASVKNLSNFIDRLADNETYIEAEIEAYMRKNKIDVLTFGDFVKTFDENGAAVKSIISQVLRNAAKSRSIKENPKPKKSKKRS